MPLIAAFALAACRPAEPSAPDPVPAGAIDVEEATRTIVAGFDGAEVVPQTGHAGGVSSLSFSPEGTHLLSIGYDETARVWDLDSGAVARVMAPIDSHNEVRELDLERRLALIGGGYQPLEAWHLDTGEHGPIGVPGEAAISIQWTDDGRHATYYDGRSLRAWTRDGDRVRDQPRELALMNVDALLEGPGLALVSAQDWIRLDRIEDGTKALELKGIRGCPGRSGPCYRAARNGDRLVVVTEAGELRVHDAGAAEPTRRIAVGEAELVGLDRDGTRALVLARQYAQLIDLERGQQLASFRAADEYLSSAALSADAGRVALGSDAGIRVLDASSGEEVFRARARAPRQAGAALSADGRQLWIAMEDGRRQWLERWDLDLVARTDRRDLGELEFTGFSSSSLLDVEPDGALWWHNAHGYLERIDVERGVQASRDRSRTRWVVKQRTDAFLRPAHGRWTVAMAREAVTVFDPEGNELGRQPFGTRLMGLVESPAGFLAWDADGKVHELEVGEGLKLVGTGGDDIDDVVFTSGGMRVQVDHQGQVSRAPRKAPEQREGCGAPVREVVGELAASPDARWVVTQQYDGKVRVWDCDEGKMRHAFELPAGELDAVRFAAAAPIALLTSRTGTSTVVQLETGKRLMLVSDGRDWAALGAGGLFAGSGGAARLLAASDGVDARSVDQYAIHLNRPDRLMSWWGSPREDAIDFYRAIARRRLERAVRRVPERVVEPPRIELRAVRIEDGLGAKVEVEARDPQGIGLRVELYVDGVPAGGKDVGSGAFEGTLPVVLNPGPNLVEVSATNEFGLESRRARLTVDPSATTQTEQRTIAGDGTFRDAEFDADATHLITLGGDGHLRWYRTDDGTEVRDVQAHPRGQALALGAKGTVVITMGADDKGQPQLRSFDARSGEPVRRFKGIPWPIYDLVATDEYVIGSGGRWGETFGSTVGGVAVWRLDQASPSWTWEGSASVATQLARVPGTNDGLFVPLAGFQGIARWDTIATKKPTIIETGGARAVGIGPEGRQVGVETDAHQLGIFDVDAGKVVREIDIGGVRIREAIWLDADRILVNADGRPPTIYSASSGRSFATVASQPVDGLALAPAVNRLALVDDDTIDLRALVPSKPLAADSKLFFVGIGVSDYRDDRLDLGLAAEDARSLADAFGGLSGFDGVSARAYVDAEVDGEVLTRVAGQLADAGPNDVVVVFIAGHGKTLTDGEPGYYFLPSDVSVDDLRATGIPFDELEAVLAAVPSRRKLLLLDTCESGEPDSQPSREGLVAARARGLEVRGLELSSGGEGAVAAPAETHTRRKPYTLERDRFVLRNVERRSGAVIFSAAGASEYALEDPKLGHGLFTAGLLEVLGSASADTDHDGRIDVTELERAVRSLVAEWSGGTQHPRIDRENIQARISFAAGG